MITNGIFLDACLRKPTSRTPVWYMRQAGGDLPYYRKLRETYDLMTVTTTPELAAAVAAEPVRAFGVDAAVLFADIMLLPMAMGVKLHLDENIGPIIHSPICSSSDIEALEDIHSDTQFDFLRDTIGILKSNLTVPVIGFSGGPFTLASYLIEGKPTRDFVKTKALMHEHPDIWRLLMGKLTRAIIRYLEIQVRAGVDALQLFDSWAGYLSREEYAQYVLPSTQMIFTTSNEGGEQMSSFAFRPSDDVAKVECHAALPRDSANLRAHSMPRRLAAGSFTSLEKTHVPRIHFATNTEHIIDLLAPLPCDVLSVDWRMSLDRTWKIVGEAKALQGNLDPKILLTDISTIEQEVDRIFAEVDHRPGFIFNLGHRMISGTPHAHVRALTDYVHKHT